MRDSLHRDTDDKLVNATTPLSGDGPREAVDNLRTLREVERLRALKKTEEVSKRGVYRHE
jgi:hypothetical protein